MVRWVLIDCAFGLSICLSEIPPMGGFGYPAPPGPVGEGKRGSKKGGGACSCTSPNTECWGGKGGGDYPPPPHVILQVFGLFFPKTRWRPSFPFHTQLNRVNQPPLATLLLGVEGVCTFLGPLSLGSGLRPPHLNRHIVFFVSLFGADAFFFVCLTVATVEHKVRLSCNMIN